MRAMRLADLRRALTPSTWVSRYRALSVGRKMGLFPALAGTGLGLVLLVSVTFGLIGEGRLARLQREYYPLVEASWQREQNLAALQRSLQDAATTTDAEHLVRADSLAAAFTVLLRGADDRHPEHEHRAIVERFQRYYADARSVTTRMMRGEMGPEITGALQAFTADQRALRAALEQDAVADRALLASAFAAERAWQRAAWMIGLALTLLTVLLLGALSRLGTRLLLTPLREAVRVADRVAAGDLDVRLPEAGSDELGHLLHTLGRMVESLRGSEDRLVHQATHDALTGLANRVLFRDRVARAEAEGDRTTMAVFYIDLDDFKDVNDGLGHEAGDQLLVAAAGRLLSATRGCDTVARLGGDEFAILLRGVRDARDAEVVAERVARALAMPFRVRGSEARVGASIGIALGRDAAEADDLLRSADLAMYSAKHAGKHRYVVFESSMRTAALERIALEADLRGALERGELLLHYQPIVRLDTQQVVGAEALVRWRHPLRGLVSPMEFIPVAEATGMIVPIGRWVLEEACRQAAEWRRQGFGASDDATFRMAVNISAWQVQNAELVDHVRSALVHNDLPPSALTLEITESVMLTDTEVTLARLHALKALGVRLAIDDFGTGYSSLAYLHRFPVDVLKIDRAFVKGVGETAHDPTLLRAIVAIGEALQLPMVAEGIEHPEQAHGLRELGCDLGQGFHFARPLPAEQITALLTGASAPSLPAPAPLVVDAPVPTFGRPTPHGGVLALSGR